MRKQLAAAVALAALTATAGVTLADQEPDAGERRLYRGAGMHGMGDPAWVVEQLDRALELGDSQRQRIENIVSAARPEMEALRERAGEYHKALRELDVSDDGYNAQLANLAREKGDIAAEMALLHGRMKAEIAEVLTPEQRQQFAEAGDRMHRDHTGKHRRWRSR
jgi:Spy/CpxP family protein refolding chaperone